MPPKNGRKSGVRNTLIGQPIERRASGDANIFRHVLPEDLVKFGLIPEFIGRLPIVGAVEQLDEAMLVAVLSEPKNSLLKQYERIFAIDGVEANATIGGIVATNR